MAKSRVLIVEDDKNIAKLVKYNFDKAGFDSIISKTGEGALEILGSESIDLIILDIMLPKMDGFEVCKQIKQNEGLSSIPIIMLTARGEETDRVVGFELGADDYVVKPFSPRELILRARAVLKRREPKDVAKEIVNVGQLKIDIPRHKVTLGKKAIELALMEFNLLLTLIERRGRVQSRERLLEDVWSIGSDVTTRTVDTHVKRLREKLGRMGKMIETVRGIGYKFSDEE